MQSTGRILIFAVLMWMVSGISAQKANDPYNAAPANVHQPVLRKLNFNYLLFTYPVAPYRDRNGSVMVPLRVVGELMGGQVYLSAARRAGTFIRPTLKTSHLLEFTAGSRRASVDENPVRMRAAPVWLERERELLVPLEPLIGAFGLKPRWDRRTNVLLRSGFFVYLESFELETLPEGYQDSEQLTPSGVALTRQGPGARQIRLSMNLKNVSGPPVQAGQQGVSLWAQYGGVAGAVVKGRNTDVPTIGPAPTDPCRTAPDHEGFVCKAVLPAFYDAISGLVSGSYPLDYLIARVRVRLRPDGP